MEKSKKPKIRFKGFNDDWEQCEFSEIAKIRRGLTYNPSNILSDGIRVLRSSNIAGDTFLYGEDDVFVNPNAINIPKVKNGVNITEWQGHSIR